MEEVVKDNKNDPSSQYLHIGDLVYLMSEEEQEDGYISGGGGAQDFVV